MIFWGVAWFDLWSDPLICPYFEDTTEGNFLLCSGKNIYTKTQNSKVKELLYFEKNETCILGNLLMLSQVIIITELYSNSFLICPLLIYIFQTDFKFNQKVIPKTYIEIW